MCGGMSVCWACSCLAAPSGAGATCDMRMTPPDSGHWPTTRSNSNSQSLSLSVNALQTAGLLDLDNPQAVVTGVMHASVRPQHMVGIEDLAKQALHRRSQLLLEEEELVTITAVQCIDITGVFCVRGNYVIHYKVIAPYVTSAPQIKTLLKDCESLSEVPATHSRCTAHFHPAYPHRPCTALLLRTDTPCAQCFHSAYPHTLCTALQPSVPTCPAPLFSPYIVPAQTPSSTILSGDRLRFGGNTDGS